jgi:hypothetical protein
MYHALFTAKSASQADLAIGLMKLSQGKADGFHDLLKGSIPFYSAVDYYMKGKGLQQKYMDRLSQDPVVQAIKDANGRFGEPDFKNMMAMTKSWQEAWDSKSVKDLIGKSGSALLHGTTPLIMEKLVPNVKFGAFNAFFEALVRDGKPWDEADVQKIWDHVDNVFGQVVYDNSFVDIAKKKVLQEVFRAYGWNMGSGKLLYKAGKELAGAPKALVDMTKGKKASLQMSSATVLAMVLH